MSFADLKAYRTVKCAIERFLISILEDPSIENNLIVEATITSAMELADFAITENQKKEILVKIGAIPND